MEKTMNGVKMVLKSNANSEVASCFRCMALIAGICLDLEGDCMSISRGYWELAEDQESKEQTSEEE